MESISLFCRVILLGFAPAFLFSSCADEDLALFGALATGAASGYAQSGGDTATANSLLQTQSDILNEASNTAAVNAAASSSASDGEGFSYTDTQVATSSNQRNASGSGIVGTWSNDHLTWTLNADGSAFLVVPSINSNGVATTYMTYTAVGGTFSYHISRSKLTGTLNCNGQSDYDQVVNKSYSEKYTLNGNSLTIGTEVMRRN